MKQYIIAVVIIFGLFILTLVDSVRKPLYAIDSVNRAKQNLEKAEADLESGVKRVSDLKLAQHFVKLLSSHNCVLKVTNSLNVTIKNWSIKPNSSILNDSRFLENFSPAFSSHLVGFDTAEAIWISVTIEQKDGKNLFKISVDADTETTKGLSSNRVYLNRASGTMNPLQNPDENNLVRFDYSNGKNARSLKIFVVCTAK